MNVTGGMHHVSTHGGSNGGTVGNIVLRVTGGRGMAFPFSEQVLSRFPQC